MGWMMISFLKDEAEGFIAKQGQSVQSGLVELEFLKKGLAVRRIKMRKLCSIFAETAIH